MAKTKKAVSTPEELEIKKLKKEIKKLEFEVHELQDGNEQLKDKIHYLVSNDEKKRMIIKEMSYIKNWEKSRTSLCSS